MNSMLNDCSSLKKLNLSKFNTNNLKYIDYMFCGCVSLEELDLPKFNFDNIKSMYHTFFELPDKLQKKINAQNKGFKKLLE